MQREIRWPEVIQSRYPEGTRAAADAVRLPGETQADVFRAAIAELVERRAAQREDPKP